MNWKKEKQFKQLLQQYTKVNNIKLKNKTRKQRKNIKLKKESIELMMFKIINYNMKLNNYKNKGDKLNE
jgi:hypothetical protein